MAVMCLLTLAVLSLVSADWAPAVNTALLVILAIVTSWGNHRASRERRQMTETAAAVSETTADIHQQITNADRVILTPPIPGGRRATDPPQSDDRPAP